MFERRKSPRVQLVAKVETRVAGFSFLAAAADVSESGMLIFTANPSSVGDTVQLDFSLPGSTKIISAKAMVVRVAPGMSMGVQFAGLAPEDLATVRRFVGK